MYKRKGGSGTKREPPKQLKQMAIIMNKRLCYEPTFTFWSAHTEPSAPLMSPSSVSIFPV